VGPTAGLEAVVKRKIPSPVGTQTPDHPARYFVTNVCVLRLLACESLELRRNVCLFVFVAVLKGRVTQGICTLHQLNTSRLTPLLPRGVRYRIGRGMR
jgi:hypothetical protein